MALITSSGSLSQSVGSDGQFEFGHPGTLDFCLHASTKDAQIGVGTPTEGRVEIHVSPGATLDVSLKTKEACRCAVFHEGLRIEDFTLRGENSAQTIVPAGSVRVELYRGSTTLFTHELVLAVDGSEVLEVALDGENG